MIFQCNDLERALRSPELMPDARAHAENCEACRRELHLWTEISRVAPQLHEEWESPWLWGRIEAGMAESAPPRRVPVWRWAMAAAASVLLAGVLLQPWRGSKPPDRQFLTDQALGEVQAAEAAYARSIEKLSGVAGQTLETSPTPLGSAYREKLRLLDSAIAELKTNVEDNRYNAYLRNQLATLYREKQRTLQEWTDHAKVN
jgi:hypothetical protein